MDTAALKNFPELLMIHDIMLVYGKDLIIGLVLIVFGMFAIKYINAALRRLLARTALKESFLVTIANVVYVVLILNLMGLVAVRMGVDNTVVCRLVFVVMLSAVAIILLIGPYIPRLPFKVGQTVKAGDLLGKVEAANLLNTRLRTFDGKTFFVPNSKIINDIVQNYNYTSTRQIKLDMAIRYEENLIRVKRLLEEIMIEDPRVLVKPRPVVYILDLASGCVQLGGRCWVSNPKYWPTRCELLEKIKLRLELEGIKLVPLQVGVQYFDKGMGPAIPDRSMG